MNLYPLDKARIDVNTCIKTWTKMLIDYYGNRILYAYAKGSAIKPWDTPIDYVPLISDVDIHFMLLEEFPLFLDEPISEALRFTEIYERSFKQQVPGYLHIPRAQVIRLNRFLKDENFIFPFSSREVKPLINISKYSTPRAELEIKKIDLEKLINLRSLVEGLPESVFDRQGLDFYTLIRRLGYEVSPAPYRFISQYLDDPTEVWIWNRTKLCDKLEEFGFSDIRDYYRDYYYQGWNVFNSNFEKNEEFRKLIKYAYELLKLIYLEATSLHI